MQGIVAEDLWGRCIAAVSHIPLIGYLSGREVQELSWRDHLIHGGLVATIVAVALALFQGSFVLAALCLSLTVPLLFASHYVNRYQELLHLQARVELLQAEIGNLQRVNLDLQDVIGDLQQQNRTFADNNANLSAITTDLQRDLEMTQGAFATFREAEPRLQEAIRRHEELVTQRADLEQRIVQLIADQELQQQRLDAIRTALADVRDALRREVQALAGVRNDLGSYVGQLSPQG